MKNWIGLGLLSVSLAITIVVAAESPVRGFFDRQRTMNIIEQKYQRWISTSEGKLRESNKKDYLTTFRRFFDGTDDWIFKTFTNDTVISQTVDEYGDDHEKLKALFQDIIKGFNDASKHHFRVANHDGEAVDQLIKIGREREAILKKKLNDTLISLTKVDWKRQFQFDAQEFLQKRTMSRTVHMELRDFLDKKYPFRQWLVLIYNANKNSWVCGAGFPYVYKKIFPNRHVIVTQVESGVKPDQKRASDWFSRIPNSKYDLNCHHRAKAIVHEATSNCQHTRVPLLGVFAHDDNDAPVIAVSKPAMLHTKLTNRASLIFCQQYYTVVLFG